MVLITGQLHVIVKFNAKYVKVIDEIVDDNFIT